MKSIYIGSYTRPDGYFGDKATVNLCLVSNKLIEVHSSGYHRSPFLEMDIQDELEAEWLINNHPNSKYRIA